MLFRCKHGVTQKHGGSIRRKIRFSPYIGLILIGEMYGEAMCCFRAMPVKARDHPAFYVNLQSGVEREHHFGGKIISRRNPTAERIKQICDEPNSRKVMIKLKKPFGENSLHRMLINRCYIGKYIYRDTVARDGIPAIIPENLFDRVQERGKKQESPTKAKALVKYLLTTTLYL